MKKHNLLKCQVIMLPTEKASNLLKEEITGKLHLLQHKSKQDNTTLVPQHLYLVSDREIKEGDYYLLDNEIVKCATDKNKEELKYINDNFPKIEATTDGSLSLNEGGKVDIGCLSLPQIHPLFIQYFIKKEGNIKEVNVKIEIGSGEGNTVLEVIGNTYNRVKTNEDNTVIISLIKEEKKSYTKEEVKSLFIKKLKGMMPKEKDVKDFDKSWDQYQCIEFGQATHSNLERLVYLRAISELDEFLDEN